MNAYRSKEWKRFREDVLLLEGNICSRCGRGRSDGVVLQVHHKIYIVGRMPWEYSYDACEVLCRGCHAQEHGIIPPKFDWQLVGQDDLGVPIGSCEYCGTEIRYVFCIQHQKWPILEVGEICCDNLTATNFASNFMNAMRRRLGRRKRFVSSSRWKVDEVGVLHVSQSGIKVGIVPVEKNFGLRMNGKLGRLRFSSVLEAKMKAFDVIASGEAVRFLRKFSKIGHQHS